MPCTADGRAMWNHMGYGWSWGMGFGMLGMALFWIIVIVGIVALVRWLVAGGTSASGPPGKTAMEVLKERYARGEIDKKEFDEKKRDLGT